MRYRADITAGALKLPESRIVADLLLQRADDEAWMYAIVHQNALQARAPATAKRLARLIRSRLAPMGPDLWELVRDGSRTVATHAVLAAAVKQSPLLGDFLRFVVGDQYKRFQPTLQYKLWSDYLNDCRAREPAVQQWSETTQRRLRSSVFQILAQAGYIDDTRSLKLQTVHIADQVRAYLKNNNEDYTLHCIQVAP
jgi:hypothetical protein